MCHVCRLPAETVYSIVAEAVELEREFCCEALSVALVGMNAELMARVRRKTGTFALSLRCIS